MDAEEFLEHYGVKGMKWGVRKKNDSSSNSPKKRSKAKTAVKVGAVVVGTAAIATVIAKSGSKPASSMRSGPHFAVSGPKGSLSVGSVKEGTYMTAETLNMLVKNINR